MAGNGLGHVRWLGGASGAAKSAIAQRLIDDHGLRVYGADAAIPAHAADPGPDSPLLARFLAMTMDERWLGRDPQSMLEHFPWFAGERFDRIERDLRDAPTTPVTVAEGFRLLPRLVEPLLDEPWQALWLVPTPAFRRTVFEARPPDLQFWRRTSDPASALERLLARDALFAETVAAEARSRRLRVLVVDGSRALPDLADEVSAWFRLAH